MKLEVILFQALIEVMTLELPPGIPSSGKKFEDYIFQQLYLALRQASGQSVLPPRYTLLEATYSGVAHQFDVVVREEKLVAIECKFRKGTGIDDLFAFLGKLVDYRTSPRGIFLTTAQRICDEVYCYAIAHHISIVSPSLAPVDYMIQRVKSDTDLSRRLLNLREHLQSRSGPKQALIQWQNEHRRFKAEGYS